jgi:lysophospholipase L1-like esterase
VVVKRDTPARGSSWAAENTKTVTDAKPDIVVVEFSANDARFRGGVSIGEARAFTRSMIRQMRTDNPLTKIYLMTTNPVLGDRHQRPLLPLYFQMYREVAQEMNVGIIDARLRWEGASFYDIPDSVHPTKEANERVTVPAISTALRSYCSLQ